MRTTRHFPLIALLLAAFVASGCGDDDATSEPAAATPAAGQPRQLPEQLTIYASLGLTGASEASASSVVNAAQLALEEAGGMAGGRRVQFVVLDDTASREGGQDTSVVRDNARAAAADEQTIAYIGEQTSGATQESLPILNQAGILQVGVTTTYAGLTQDGGVVEDEPAKFYPTGLRTFGRLIPADQVQAAAQVELMEALGCNGVQAVHDGTPYGEGLAQQVAAAASGTGVAPSRTDEFDPQGETFPAIVAALRETGADCLAVGADNGPGLTALVLEARGVNPDLRIIVGDAGSDTEFTSSLGEQERNVYVTFPVLDPRYLNDQGEQFGRVYAQRFGGPPEASAIYGYEVMRAILAAMDAAGERSNDRSAVLAGFFGLRDRESAVGTYSITDTGDSTITEYGAYRVEAGELAFDRVLGAGGEAPPVAVPPLPEG